MILLSDLKPNKISVDLTQYSMMLSGDTGDGKTTCMLKFLKSICPDKEPLFLEFEDRFQNIPNIVAVRIREMSDLKSIVNQLNNPALKEKFSCVVIDTIDKFEEFGEKYVTDSRDAEIIKDVGTYGEGTQRYRSVLRTIGDIQKLGYVVHFIAQNVHSKVKVDKTEYDVTTLKLNKNTASYVSEPSYLIGRLIYDEVQNKRFVTFKKSRLNPNLKDTFGLPDVINVDELKDVWTKTIENKYGSSITNEQTIDRTVVHEDFEEIKKRGMELGNLLAKNGRVEEATAVLKRNLGIDDNGNVKMFDSLKENQIELTKVIVIELEGLVDKYITNNNN